MDNRPEELVLYVMAECMAGEVTGEVKLDLWNAAAPALPVIARDENANSTDASMLPGNDPSVDARRNLGVEHPLDRLAHRHTRRWSRLRHHGRPPLRGRREFKVPNALIHSPDPPLVVIQTVKPSS